MAESKTSPLTLDAARWIKEIGITPAILIGVLYYGAQAIITPMLQSNRDFLLAVSRTEEKNYEALSKIVERMDRIEQGVQHLKAEHDLGKGIPDVAAHPPP